MYSQLKSVDLEIFNAIQGEISRLNSSLELIASENFVSTAVLEAAGCVMTNKYAEGYPGKRYYGGCEFVDQAENLARERAKKLFDVEYVNVQPHSGAQANMAAYFAVLKEGDTILGLDLAHGGHLTHGSPVNFSGKLFRSVPYGVEKETGMLDYNKLADLAEKEKPNLILAGFSAYPRALNFAKFREIADNVGAFLVADIAHIAGLVAVGEHESPVPHCDIVTTTTHKTLRGPRGGMIMVGSKYADKIITDPWTGKERKLRGAIASRVFPGSQGGPLMHIIAAKAVAFKEALTKEFTEYIKQVVLNAKTLADALSEGGYCLVSGGTDNHLLLVDLSSKGITGKDAEEALEDSGITVNKNMVPFDKQTPMVTSGIRIGTPALTSRGMKEPEMVKIGNLICNVLDGLGNKSLYKSTLSEIKDLCREFPLYSS
ncbi:serine hydroxymethyltransferase [candidate division KSB1 bacterium]|nr:serine hydroxymethyltransferase [candidate division KSB1 bacterium]